MAPFPFRLSSLLPLVLSVGALLPLALGGAGTSQVGELLRLWLCGAAACGDDACPCNEVPQCCARAAAPVPGTRLDASPQPCHCCTLPLPEHGEDGPPMSPTSSRAASERIAAGATIAAHTPLPWSCFAPPAPAAGERPPGSPRAARTSAAHGLLAARRLASTGGEVAAALGCALI